MSIWKNRFIKKSVELSDKQHLTLEEGYTPVDKIELDNNSYLFIKREDKNPTGSWKDRGTAYKISILMKEGVQEAVISSSGNAAISFLKYANNFQNFKMHIVLSTEVNEQKKDIITQLAGDTHEIYFDNKARKKAARISAEKNIPNLRASTDDEIVKGYWSLGSEIAKEIINKNRNMKAKIYCSVSSGTTAVGIAHGLQLELEKESNIPPIVLVQTQSCHPLVEDTEVSEVKSYADAIVDKSLLRKPMLEKIIKETKGYALSISNDELENAKEFVEKSGIELSYTSLLGIAAFLREYKKDENSIFITIASGR